MSANQRRRALAVLAAGTLTAATVRIAMPASASVLPPECSPSGSTVTCTYTYTGAEQQFVVPAGVTSLGLVVVGAHGGHSGFGTPDVPGGDGEKVFASLSSVVPGTTYYVEVGGNAFHDDSSCQTNVDCKGGFNGGGSTGGALGAGTGGGGGGASDLRSVSSSASGTLDSRIVVSPGGGGGGQSSTCAGGNGGVGSTSGNDGTACPQPGGTGGGTGGLDGGTPGQGNDYFGQPAGSGDGQKGNLGSGGAGGFSGGGAGGGGLWGGAGGGNNTAASGTTMFSGGAGGGGGGSNLIPNGGSFAYDDTATPQVVITYSTVVATRPTISGTPPAGGVKEPYSFDFTTTGSPSPTVSRTSGTLPPGLSLSSSGHLSGTPTKAGTYHFTVRAHNGAGSRSKNVTMLIRPVPSIRSGGASTLEGNSGSQPLTITLTLSRSSTIPVTVQWTTANSSAKAPQDFAAASGTVTFNPGQTSRTLAVSVHGDKVHEPNETFYVLLHNATHAGVATPNVPGTIRNDD